MRTHDCINTLLISTMNDYCWKIDYLFYFKAKSGNKLGKFVCRQKCEMYCRRLKLKINIIIKYANINPAGVELLCLIRYGFKHM